jgi:hypothetical protein
MTCRPFEPSANAALMAIGAAVNDRQLLRMPLVCL